MHQVGLFIEELKGNIFRPSFCQPREASAFHLNISSASVVGTRENTSREPDASDTAQT